MKKYANLTDLEIQKISGGKNHMMYHIGDAIGSFFAGVVSGW